MNMRTALGAGLVSLCLAATAWAAPPTYRVTDIGLPEGHDRSEGSALSERGEVIGYSMGHRTGSQNFAWSASTGRKPWHGPTRHPSVLLIDLNKQRQVAGSIDHPFVDGAPHVGFVWHPDTGTQLMDGLSAGGGDSGVMALNDRGVATGWYTGATAELPHAFVWTQQTGMVDIHPNGYDRSEPMALNNRGQVLALAYPPGSRDWELTVLSMGGVVERVGCMPLAGQPKTYCYASSINDRRQVAGQVSGTVGVDGHGVPVHPVIWTAAAGMVDISAGTPFANDSGDLLDINHRGQVVGRLVRRGAGVIETFYWDAENGMHKVEDLVDPADPLKGRFLVTGGPSYINSKGMILLNARVEGDPAFQRTLVLTPVR
ncbi:hypothetical protein [Ideonella sp.]|uniref:hypothetical protein n=1 Tax=Ideonella sp. TaxID=1929293 RepID=UPI0035AF489F